MVGVYEEETLAGRRKQSDRNFMSTLVRASQNQTREPHLEGLTESDIYGNMFTLNFAGHDTTAHAFTFALYFLGAHPECLTVACRASIFGAIHDSVS